MFREKVLVSFVLVFVLSSAAFAPDEINNRWQAYGGGQWDNAGNWEMGVPTLGQDARIDQPGLGPTISDGTTAVCDTLRGPSFEGGECAMTIDGGLLEIEYDWRIGDDPGSGPGIVNMNGGQVHLKANPKPGDEDPGRIKIGGSGEAIFNMYDGVVVVGPGEPPFTDDSGRMKISHEGGKGTLNIYGGRFYVPEVMLTDIEWCGQAYINVFGGLFACAELIYPGTCPGSPKNDWLIDVYDGIIQVMGYGGADASVKATIDGYVASGNIIAEGGAGQVVVELNAGVVSIYSGVGPVGCACAGDLNGDGQRDLDDLQAVADILLAAGSPFVVPVEPNHCGDTNSDGQVDLDDLQAVADILLATGSPFVVPCQ